MLSARNEAQSLLWLALAVLLAYANAWMGAFQFDDYHVIVNNPVVHSWQAWWQDLPNGLRPLLKLSYTLDWTSGLGVAGFHLSNLLIHLACVVLVYKLTQRFAMCQPLLADQQTIPLLVALLFAVHPVHTEAVTYISGRSSALATMFYLLGLWLYDRAVNNDSKVAIYLWVPLCMVLAVLVKETALTFPFALLLWEGFRRESWKELVKRQWVVWGLFGTAILLLLLQARYRQLLFDSAQMGTLAGNFATQLQALFYLLHQWIFPWNLNIDPELPRVHGINEAAWQFVLCVTMLVLTWKSRKVRPWLSFAFAWLMLHLFVLHVLLPRLDVANERQLYLVSWPLLLAVVAELSFSMARQKVKMFSVALAIVLMILTLTRNGDYRTEISLWEATVKDSPGKARAHNNLGYAYLQAGRKEEARAHFLEALRMDSGYYKATYNLMRLDD